MKFTTEHLSQSNINAINAVIQAYQQHSEDWTPQRYVTWCLISKTNEILDIAEKRRKADESSKTSMQVETEDSPTQIQA